MACLPLLGVFLAIGIFSGVRSTVERKGAPHPARGKNCTIQFAVEEGSERPYEIVGVIQVYVRRNKITMGRKGTYEEAVPEFEKQACKLGADAVIIRQQTISHSGEFKLLYVKGDAVAFTAKTSD
jgi:hypothetical protein